MIGNSRHSALVPPIREKCGLTFFERQRILLELTFTVTPLRTIGRRAMESKAVGMIGLGIMGSAMSSNLIRAGFKVLGYDVLPRRRQEHRKAGGTAARNCREVARRCDILVTSLPSSEALLDTAAELAKSSRANQIVIETSTLPI